MLQLSDTQDQALKEMMQFIFDKENDVFILSGGAGSGKTTVIANLAHELNLLETHFEVIAPTGRAARVLSNKLGQFNNREINGVTAAKTIHSSIYEFSHIEKGRNDESLSTAVFELKEEKPAAKVFIVDESSMVGDMPSNAGALKFGSTCLLTDLFEFSRRNITGQKIKIIFVGDDAQLMPINESLSPALNAQHLAEQYGKAVLSFHLDTCYRQDEQSAILKNALAIRKCLQEGDFSNYELKVDAESYIELKESELASKFVELHQADEDCIIIANTNAQAKEYNQQVRTLMWDDATDLQVGDRLVVQQNSARYHLLNGDHVIVERIYADTQVVSVPVKNVGIVELRFRKIQIKDEINPENNAHLQEVFILENLLDSHQGGISLNEKRALEAYFNQRFKHLSRKSMEYQMERVWDDYLNVLFVKYGYAITCHKAQGGEWDNVFVDFTHVRAPFTDDFLRWTYTAMTRASKRLFQINMPNIGMLASFKKIA